MKKRIFIIILIAVSIFFSCDTTDYTTLTYYGYESYLSYQDYQTLLDNLESESNINRSVIDSELDNLNVRQDYDDFFYDGTTSICYSMRWSSYNSTIGDWDFYVDVDIWVSDSGSLKRDMCSYYSD